MGTEERAPTAAEMRAAEDVYVKAGRRIDAARGDLRPARSEGRLDAAGAEYRAAEEELLAARRGVEAVFGPDYGRGSPDLDEYLGYDPYADEPAVEDQAGWAR